MTSRIKSVFDQIDKINKEDPNHEIIDGQSIPKELIYGHRMTEVLHQITDTPSEILQIAARGQHIARWKIARSDYPMNRNGYLKWRTQLKIFHGETLADIMKAHDYSPSEIKKMKAILMKKDLKTDTDTQLLEDTLCLVFLKFHVADFVLNKDEEMIINIIRKTWAKMSENAHEEALKLPYPPNISLLLQKALSTNEE